jgi:hypothetical protein
MELSEKQTHQVVEKIEKQKEQIEGLESSVVLTRQTLFATEPRARAKLFSRQCAQFRDDLLQ